MNEQLTCEQRVDDALQNELSNLKILWELECEGNEEYHEDLGTLNEYGLCFDYVEPGTYDEQAEGYYRYQLSYGGPSDEFRVYVNEYKQIHRVEYWFLDWFDGASRRVNKEAAPELYELLDYYLEIVPELT